MAKKIGPKKKGGKINQRKAGWIGKARKVIKKRYFK